MDWKPSRIKDVCKSMIFRECSGNGPKVPEGVNRLDMIRKLMLTTDGILLACKFS